jgi:hypothetical protein
MTMEYEPFIIADAVHSSSGLLLPSRETVHVILPSFGEIPKVPPFKAVMKDGGPGVAAKVKGAPTPTATLPDAGLTVMAVTFPITVAAAVALRA